MPTKMQSAVHKANKGIIQAIAVKARKHKDPFTGELFYPKTVREANIHAMVRLQNYSAQRFNDLYPTYSEIEAQICITLQKIMNACTLHDIEVACREDKSGSDGGHIWAYMDMVA